MKVCKAQLQCLQSWYKAKLKSDDRRSWLLVSVIMADAKAIMDRIMQACDSAILAVNTM